MFYIFFNMAAIQGFVKLSNNSSSVRCLHISAILSQIRILRRPVCTSSDYNPLFEQDSLPKFKKIESTHVAPAIQSLTQEYTKNFKTFESQIQGKLEEDVNWQSVIEPIERLNSELEYAWSIVTHLNGVKNSEDLRNAYQKVQPLVVKSSTLVSQSKPFYSALEKLNNKSSELDEAQQRIITSFLRASRNGGVGLQGKEKERFNEIKIRLAELGTKFSNNVLDAVKQFSIIVTDWEDMQGLPESLLQLTAMAAAVDQQKRTSDVDPKKGPWKLTLDIPCFQPFMQYSENRELRKRLYKAYITRASQEQTDNSDIIEEMRSLRAEKASLLDFKDHASLSLESKMAGYPDEVWKLITELKDKSKNAAIREVEQLKAFASSNGFKGDIQLWDIPYWAEKQRQYLFSFNDEQLRPYFPLERVLDGLFKFTTEILGVTIKAADGEADVWHEDVRFFKIFNEKGDHAASFFLDPYSRPAEKRGGAWMDQCTGKSGLMNRIPVAYLVCNQSPPNNNTPSLMTFHEVETLFHEFGHGLQHMLTTVPYTDAAGIHNVEWDAVELPSQFMENWMYDKTTVDLVSGHYKTGQTLPDDIFTQITKARRYMAGSGMLRQLYFSALDMELHTSTDPWREVMHRIAKDYTVIPPLDEDHFPCSFLHIFGGGYSAGYYSYKWAEVMSADAFSAFQEVGLENRSELARIGRKFRDTILAKGGSRHPRDVFHDFRGRRPKPDALLSIYGLD